MTAPHVDLVPNEQDAQLWEQMVDRGLSKAAATEHIRRRQMARRGPEVSAAERQAAEDPGALAALGLGFSRGATLGLGDEAAALLAGAGAALPGGRSPAEAFRAQLAETRDATQEAEAARPGTVLAGDVAGTVAGVGGGFRTAARVVGRPVGRILAALGARRAAALGARAATGATVGGVGTGLEAAGRAEGPFSARLRAARDPALVGAATGAALSSIPLDVAKIGPIQRALKQLDREAAALARPVRQAAKRAPEPAAHRRTGPIRRALMALMQRRARGSAAATEPRPRAEAAATPAKKEAAREALLRRQIGEPAFPGKPELGTVARPGPSQRAGPPERTASLKLPDMAMRLEHPEMLAQFPTEVLTRRLAQLRGSLRPSQIEAVEAELARRRAPGAHGVTP
jgi:hypothetical protein